MVLTVDIGNSNIVIGVWNNASLELTDRIQTRRDYTSKELMNSFNGILSKFACAYEGAILSSVVPEITDVMLHVLENITGKRPLLMGPFLRTGVDISDYAPGAIGMDRIVDLSAAVVMYGAPVMTCDLGTCTTITVAGNDGKLIGGMICPGIQLSLDAEAQRASQLPQLTAGNVDSLLGKDTASNMMSGTVAATGLMLSELADRLDIEDLKVVITGGLGRYVMPWIKCNAEVYYEPDLLLRGLYEIYRCNSDVDIK